MQSKGKQWRVASTRNAIVLTGLIVSAVGYAQVDGRNPLAITYAQMHKVSVREAADRLEQMDEAGVLGGRLEREMPDVFAGLYIEHEPKFRVVVQFTKDPEKNLARYTHDPLYVAKSAPRSLELLESTQDELGERLLKSGAEFTTDVDIKKSEINVYTSDPLTTSAKVSSLSAATGFIKFRGFTASITPTVGISGGTKLEGTVQNCTAGFNVVNANLLLGVVTAGHCDNTDLTHVNPSATLAFESEKNKGSYDVQWNRQKTGTQREQSNDLAIVGGPQSLLRITKVKNSADLAIGATVCKMGITTNYTCGEVINKTSQSDWNGEIGTYIQVHNSTSQVMTIQGDSGGPVFGTDTAIGIVHGRGEPGKPNYNDLYFMPIERLAGIGVSVITMPFTIGSVPDATGQRGTVPIPVQVNFKGYPKFPVTFNLDVVTCDPHASCSPSQYTFQTVQASPLVFQYKCTGTSPYTTTSRWRTKLTDASGIVTLSVEHNVTCTKNV